MTRVLLLLLLSLPVYAVGVDRDALDDPEKEAIARDIMKGIRCLVCQNQSIEDSNADLALDLRRIVRERIAAGDSPDQVRAFLVDRYGPWVLLNPPVDEKTALLWLAPLGLLVIGGLAAAHLMRRRPARANAPQTTLSAEEAARAQALLEEKG